jgi:hypothetical protein
MHKIAVAQLLGKLSNEQEETLIHENYDLDNEVHVPLVPHSGI